MARNRKGDLAGIIKRAKMHDGLFDIHRRLKRTKRYQKGMPHGSEAQVSAASAVSPVERVALLEGDEKQAER